MKLFSLLFLLSSTTAFSQTIPAILKKVSQENDPMPALGKYRNQTVENNRRRTIIFLSAEDKKLFGIDPQTIAFANFRHNNQFFIATIPGMKSNQQGRPSNSSSLIDKIVLSKKHWAGKTRPETKEMEVHAEVIYYFRPGFGVELIYNQNNQSYLSKPQVLSSLVVSIEAIRSSKDENAPFFPSALGPNFATGHRIISLHERNMQHRDDPERTTTSYRLTMNDTKSKRVGFGSSEAILAGSLEKSNDIGRKEAYQIIINNCTNNIFNIFDENLSYNQSKDGKINYSLIKQDIVDFMNKDLNSMLTFLESMADTYKNYVDDKTRETLRKYVVNHTIVRVEDMNISKSKNPDNLMYQIPAFIDGHLRARGLLK